MEILKKYPNWSFNFDYDGEWTGSAMSGDTNCPISKQYDPSDGHGFSYVRAENKGYPTIELCIEELINQIKLIIPGEPILK